MYNVLYKRNHESKRRHKLAVTLTSMPSGNHQTYFITIKKYLGLYIQVVIAKVLLLCRFQWLCEVVCVV